MKVFMICMLILMELTVNNLMSEETKENGNRGYLYEVNELKESVPVNDVQVPTIVETIPVAIPAAPEYVVDPPDAIRISVRNEPDLSIDTTVRPDGKISYLILGEIFVQGLTPMQIKEHISDKLARYIKNADISVEVTGFNSKYIYVVGEVNKPVAVKFTGNQRVLDVLLRGADWINIIGAKESKIRIVRPDPIKPVKFTVNLNQIVKEGNVRENMYLQANDIVLVPPKLFRRLTIGINYYTSPLQSLGNLGGQAILYKSFYDLANPAKPETPVSNVFNVDVSNTNIDQQTVESTTNTLK